MKNQYRGGDWLKRWRRGQFADLKGCLTRKRGVVFLRGVDTLMLTMDVLN